MGLFTPLAINAEEKNTTENTDIHQDMTNTGTSANPLSKNQVIFSTISLTNKNQTTPCLNSGLGVYLDLNQNFTTHIHLNRLSIVTINSF